MNDQALMYLRTALDKPDADFRPGQRESIEGILRNQRQLVVQKTGWGKSMVYFLGTRLLRDKGKGPTLLISPLLSLMRNQLLAAERIGVRAATINSSNIEKWEEIEKRLLGDEIDLLLISPERLANDDFRERVLQQVADRVGLFVVDEAHCISDWGHDFRPDYRRIVRILQVLPRNIPVLATTATANNRVIRDVADQLGNLGVVRGSLTRESLSLQNIWLPSPAARMAWLAEQLKNLPGSGIIYTLTIKDSERVAQWLKLKGYAVESYHSNVGRDYKGENNEVQLNREDLEQYLLENKVKALVATVALGMGFDKPDLGFVIHFQRPGSVVHYYQQVGRAGRAVEHAYGILLSGDEDKDITDYFIRTAFPPEAHVEKILTALNKAENGLSLSLMQRQINLSRRDIEKVLKLLSVENPSPVTKIKYRWYATPVNYKVDDEKTRQLAELRQAEQSEIIEYMKTRECLMRYIVQALDDPKATECGKCANCVGSPLVPTTFSSELVNQAAIFLKRDHQIIKPRKQWPAGNMFEYHPSFKGLNIGPALMAEEGRALSLWGDAGWGEMVRDGKYQTGRFTDELVEGCLQMIEVWKPDPAPTWVTCIPSLRHPELVPDFARRLAARMDLPFVPCLKKERQNEEQKHMQNSYQQAKNLDGVFEVDVNSMREGPVLLLDDMVDSKWTFTIAAALLRQAGCPTVLPLALALNSPRAG